MHAFRTGRDNFRNETYAFRRETRGNFDAVLGRPRALEALVYQLARRVDALTHVVGLKRGAASLRQAATEHHGAVLGRGVLISKLNERRGRVERHLGLPPGRSSYRGAFTGTTLTLLKGLPPVLSSWVLHTR